MNSKAFTPVITSAKDVRYHLDYWKTRLGDFALVYLTPKFICKEKQQLAYTINIKGLEAQPCHNKSLFQVYQQLSAMRCTYDGLMKIHVSI
jgi:hypothetical protein